MQLTKLYLSFAKVELLILKYYLMSFSIFSLDCILAVHLNLPKFLYILSSIIIEHTV